MKKVITENRNEMLKKNRYPNAGRQIDTNVGRQLLLYYRLMNYIFCKVHEMSVLYRFTSDFT